MEVLKKNTIIPVVKAGKAINLEIRTNVGQVYSYTATLLDDINVYNKNDGNPNYYIPADKITLVYIQCLINGVASNTGQRHTGTLSSIYQDLITHINSTGTAIVEANGFSVFKNENGQTLEQLK